MYLLYYINRNIFQGVACRIEMFCDRFLQTSVFDIQTMAIHLYVERILCLSYVLFFTFVTLDNVDHVGCFTICRGFHSIYLPCN